MQTILAAGVESSLWSFVIPGIVSLIVVILTNRNSKIDKDKTIKTDLYKVELESLQHQRESARVENDSLREALKDELEDCRTLRRDLEEALQELRVKIYVIEAELLAWRNGLRTPTGFILVRLPENESINLNTNEEKATDLDNKDEEK